MICLYTYRGSGRAILALTIGVNMKITWIIVTLLMGSAANAGTKMSSNYFLEKGDTCPICLVADIELPDGVSVLENDSNELSIQIKQGNDIIEEFTSAKAQHIDKVFDNGEALSLSIKNGTLAMTLYMKDSEPVKYELQAE